MNSTWYEYPATRASGLGAAAHWPLCYAVHVGDDGRRRERSAAQRASSEVGWASSMAQRGYAPIESDSVATVTTLEPDSSGLPPLIPKLQRYPTVEPLVRSVDAAQVRSVNRLETGNTFYRFRPNARWLQAVQCV